MFLIQMRVEAHRENFDFSIGLSAAVYLCNTNYEIIKLKKNLLTKNANQQFLDFGEIPSVDCRFTKK